MDEYIESHLNKGEEFMKQKYKRFISETEENDSYLYPDADVINDKNTPTDVG